MRHECTHETLYGRLCRLTHSKGRQQLAKKLMFWVIAFIHFQHTSARTVTQLQQLTHGGNCCLLRSSTAGPPWSYHLPAPSASAALPSSFRPCCRQSPLLRPSFARPLALYSLLGLLWCTRGERRVRGNLLRQPLERCSRLLHQQLLQQLFEHTLHVVLLHIVSHLHRRRQTAAAARRRRRQQCSKRRQGSERRRGASDLNAAAGNIALSVHGCVHPASGVPPGGPARSAARRSSCRFPRVVRVKTVSVSFLSSCEAIFDRGNIGS